MTSDEFFGQSAPQSSIKSAIVAEFFWAWATILYKHARKCGKPLRYLDLYAGRGEYKDGTPSTPILVIERAVGDEKFRDLVEVHLSDVEPAYCTWLGRVVRSIVGVDLLRSVPHVEVREVDDTLTKHFEQTRLPPTLSFVDPCGYRGMSVRLIRALTKDWGCDCIFFFNFNRVNAAMANPVVVAQMDAMFGEARAAHLRQRLTGLSPAEREQAITAELTAAIEEGGSRRVLPFRVKFGNRNRTSHYLVYVAQTRGEAGFEIMKNIMAKYSTGAVDGVPTYELDPAQSTPAPPRVQQLSLLPALGLIDPPRPLEELGSRLLDQFADRTLSVVDVYREYNRMDYRYLSKNYKAAIRRLEEDGRIELNPPSHGRRPRNGVPTLPGWVRVTFPPRSE